jgi:hypothetical protein
VIAPEVPGSRSVGQPILGHEANGERDNAVGVVAPRRGQIGQVGREATSAAIATVLGVDDPQLQWPTAAQVAEVMQSAPAQVVAIGGPPTAGAATTTEVARAESHARRREILHTGDALSGIGEVLTGCHARFSRAEFPYTDRAERMPKRGMHSPSLLQSQISR